MVYEGKELMYLPEDNQRMETSFTVANDLSRFTYARAVQNLAGGGTNIAAQELDQGVLRVVGPNGQRQQIPVGQALETNNLICPGLLDFFSSVAGRKPALKGTALSAALVEAGDQGPMIYMMHFWVKKGEDQTPLAIRQAHGEGDEVRVDWMIRGGVYKTQRIYYDQEHQLVWQKDLSEPPETMEVVGRDEVESAYGESGPILERWLREDTDEDEEHVDVL